MKNCFKDWSQSSLQPSQEKKCSTWIIMRGSKNVLSGVSGGGGVPNFFSSLLFFFFSFMRGERIQIPLKAGHHRPARECWPGSVVIRVFRGSGPVLLKKAYIFVIFQGVWTPCPPPRLDPGMIILKRQRSKRIQNKLIILITLYTVTHLLSCQPKVTVTNFYVYYC